MSSKVIYSSKWDALGISASAICAIHCLLLPVFVSSMALLGVEFLENIWIEMTTLVISLLAGSIALSMGYRKHHRKVWPLHCFVFGMLLLIAGNLWHEQEILFKSVALMAILTAHIVNWRLGRKCTVHKKMHIVK